MDGVGLHEHEQQNSLFGTASAALAGVLLLLVRHARSFQRRAG